MSKEQQWKLVPVEPTGRMLGEGSWSIGPGGNAHTKEQARKAYAAMLAAAPQPPALGGDSVAWQFYDGGKWHNGMNTNNHRANTEQAGIPVRDLYRSPVDPGEFTRLQAEVERLNADLVTANEKIDKAWNKTTAKLEGFIPGGFDAWKRPVKQFLPYDFSGNPGASATQYCNGWNDSGSYWKNHCVSVEAERDSFMARTAELEALLLTLRNHTSVSENQIAMIDAALNKTEGQS